MESLTRNFPSLSALSDFSKLSKDDRSHLKNVYVSLAFTLVAATAGSSLIFLLGRMVHGLALFSGLIGLGLIFGMKALPDNGKNHLTRLGLLLGFGFCTGLSMGPLLLTVAEIDPTLISAALGGTVVIFTCFSLAALYAEERSMLYLGGYLMSGLMMLMISSLVNIFLGSSVLFELQLYLGLAIFCAFVLYDTQLIVERRRNGDKDYLGHSLSLFLDFVDIFRHLLIIMAKDSKKKRKD